MSQRPESPTTAYVNGSYFQLLLEIFTRVRPDTIDNRWLVINGIPEGNAFPLLSAVKFLGIVDEKGKVTDPKLLIRLGNPQERQVALREIVDRTYGDLLTSTAIEDATINSVDLYFQYHGVKPSLSGKAARFFFWIAQAAGYKLGEVYTPQPPSTRDKSRKQPKPNEKQNGNGSEEATESQSATSERAEYEEELLRILLDNMRQSGQLPETDLLKEITSLIGTIKKYRPSNTS